ncbi:MAG: flotillin family protein [Alistipes sp.]|nr:flotillin family protein [Alistipes sp.]
MSQTLFFVIIAVAIVLIAIVVASYVKAPPAVAFIISGLSKTPRVLIGKGGFRLPFFERLDKVYLGQISVDIKTENAVPTRDFINVDVDAVAKVRVTPTEDGIRLAAKNFLNMEPHGIALQLKDSLQGNMREIVGTLDLKSLNTDRDGFSDEVMKKATPDMAKLGIEIISCNIQDITDQNNLIRDLGADNTYKIKKDAAIAKAHAEREIAEEQAKAAKLANDARVISDTAIAEKDNELAIRRAELKIESDTRKAVADAAYEIEKQKQLAEINTRTVDARIEQTRREQVLSEEQIKITENELASQIKKQAEADKYKTEVDAEAALEQRKRDAEAKRYEAEQEAEALKAKAEARKFELEQEALGIKAKGEAEAYAIKQKGVAEADAMDKKAEAYKKYNGAAIAEMMIKILPEMAGRVSDAIKSIDGVTIYGTNGSEVSQMSSNVPVLIKQTMDVVSEATGVDMRGIIRANSIEARTDRNIDIEATGVIPTTEQK